MRRKHQEAEPAQKRAEHRVANRSDPWICRLPKRLRPSMNPEFHKELHDRLQQKLSQYLKKKFEHLFGFELVLPYGFHLSLTKSAKSGIQRSLLLGVWKHNSAP